MTILLIDPLCVDTYFIRDCSFSCPHCDYTKRVSYWKIFCYRIQKWNSLHRSHRSLFLYFWRILCKQAWNTPMCCKLFFFFVLKGITTCSNHLSLFNFIPISYILNLVGICTSYDKLCFCDSPRYMQVLLKNKRYVDSDVVSGSFHKTVRKKIT